MTAYKTGQKVKVVKVPNNLDDYIGCGFPVLGSVGRVSREIAPLGRVAISFYGKRVPTVGGDVYLDVPKEDPITIFIDFDCIEKT